MIYLCTYNLYHSSQRVGITTELPNDVPDDLYTSGGKAGSHEWVFAGNTLYHSNKHTDFKDLPKIGNLTPGQSVGLLVTPNGQLHLVLDGIHCREIATGLPVDTPLWGAADVHSRCSKIKSEIMSGESSRVAFKMCGRRIGLSDSR